ncbi:MAG: VOC family protein [Candidatus Diapherotrites archaeon]|nr:VOC family protein [Candidatus Diapherotrites archaeon]
MPPILNVNAIDHINMSVKDLEKSVRFYREVFGFEIKEDQSKDASYIIGNAHVKLCLYEDKNLHVKEGLNHFGFHIENFDEIISRCKEMGVPVSYDGAIEWKNPARSKSIYITDPSGYVIELSNLPGGGL